MLVKIKSILTCILSHATEILHMTIIEHPGGGALNSETYGGLVLRSEPKPPKYLSKNSNIKKCQIIPPKYFLMKNCFENFENKFY